MPRILIASPVRKPPDILSAHLDSLEALNTGGLEIAFLFLNDNDDPESSELLLRFAGRHPATVLRRNRTLPDYQCDDRTHRWRDDLVMAVANAKNHFIKTALRDGYDAIFLVDSDLVLHPDTLLHLVSLDKDIVSEVFWTQWQPDAPYLPNAWKLDHYTLYDRQPNEVVDADTQRERTLGFLRSMRDGGCHRVGGLGACTLVSARAMRRGVDFRPVSNLSLWGEDRWFCIRAAVLDLELWADTRYPPLHLYRDSDLARVPGFWRRVRTPPRVTLSMLVRNEADRYLRPMLQQHRHMIDDAVILDDGSTDRTVEVVHDCLADIPHHVHSAESASFEANESRVRQQQWQRTLAHDPDWILNLDADEIFEDRAVGQFRRILSSQGPQVVGFRLFDFWSDTHYRDDGNWNAHTRYLPMLLRYTEEFKFIWSDRALHCGRFPYNIGELAGMVSDLRIRHYGWARPEDRQAKHDRYRRLDPADATGRTAQMESILDPAPNLVRWDGRHTAAVQGEPGS